MLGRQQVWTCLIIMLMLMLCQFVPYTYIAPLLQEVTGLDAGLVPWVLLLNGLGATAGVFVGGKLSDRRLMPSLITMLALQAVVLAVIYAVSPYPVPMVAALTLSGAGSTSPSARRSRRASSAGQPMRPTWRRRSFPSGFNVGIAHRRLGRRDDAQRRLPLPQPAAGRRGWPWSWRRSSPSRPTPGNVAAAWRSRFLREPRHSNSCSGRAAEFRSCVPLR